MAQIVLEHPWALLALPLAWLLLLLFAWRRRFKPFGPFLLRLLIVVLVALALAQPVYIEPEAPQEITPEEPRVLLLDQSASLSAPARQRLRTEALRLLEAHPNTDLLVFADRPLLVSDPAANLAESIERLDPEITDLAEALTTGANLLAGQPGRLLLLSDGQPTTGDALAAAHQLARRQTPVDVLLSTPAGPAPNEVRLVEVAAPPLLRQGQTFDVVVTLHSQVAAQVTLELTQPIDQAVLASDEITLEPGLNVFNFTSTAEEEGLQTFEAVVSAGEDNQLENNRLAASTRVFPPPQILVVSDDFSQASPFAAWLRAAGFETEVMRPLSLPTRLSELEPYAGMVLLDLPASDLELEQMIAVQEFVRSLGRGLLVAGGRDSYILGRYDDTPLADLLPVSLEPPPREERPPVALLLIVDHSGSMLEAREPATRLTMAKEAAIRATDILGPDDLIGVLMFDNRYDWVVPFQQVSDGAELLEVQQRIARIPGGGGTRILQALEVGLPALIEQETVNVRHAVLLTDGKSFDGDSTIEDYDLIVEAAIEANITLSTIAIGTGADEELLIRLAEQGQGRYHFAETPEELPALTISESDILRSNALQEGDFGVAIFAPHPLLRGLFSPLPEAGQQPPPLSGYLAMTPKPQAEVALQVGPGDPLLSVWGYGLGRVVAWSSDTGDEWASAWRDWPEFSRFWGQVMGYTLPDPTLGLLQLEAHLEPESERVTLVAETVTAAGRPVDLQRPQATLTTPAGRETQFPMGQTAPGRYERTLRLPDPGAYALTVTQPRPEAADETAAIGFVVPYPAEYNLPGEDAGPTLLAEIAVVTGGETFSLNQPLPAEAIPAAQAAAQTKPLELWPWLLQIALILWPVEIAWRRWARLRIQ